MSDKSKIEWTDATWNPVRGCSKVSPGCENCYAMRIAARFNGPGRPYEGLAKRKPVNWTGALRFSPHKLDEPLSWQRPRRIFVNSMSDLFHELVPREFVARVFGVMAYARRHTFQVLTKRSRRMADIVHSLSLEECLNAAGLAPDFDPAWPLANVWLGTSIESAQYYDRLQDLLDTPAAIRYVSAEPLLGPVDFGLRNWADIPRDDCRLDWVIVGGESGEGSRPMHPDWPRLIRDDCLAAGVPFFFKQWGDYVMPSQMSDAVYAAVDRKVNLAGVPPEFYRVGKKRAGRLLDGREWNEFPKVPASPVG